MLSARILGNKPYRVTRPTVKRTGRMAEPHRKNFHQAFRPLRLRSGWPDLALMRVAPRILMSSSFRQHSPTLEERFTLDHGRVLLSGNEALVRMALAQRRRDVANGLNTAGFVSG